MTTEAILRQIAEKELRAKEEGIKQIILDFRMLLSKLRVVTIPNSSLNSYAFIKKYSPIFKKKV